MLALSHKLSLWVGSGKSGDRLIFIYPVSHRGFVQPIILKWQWSGQLWFWSYHHRNNWEQEYWEDARYIKLFTEAS